MNIPAIEEKNQPNHQLQMFEWVLSSEKSNLPQFQRPLERKNASSLLTH